MRDTRAEQVGTHTALRRRRRCEACGHSWYTFELPEEVAAPLLSKGPQSELRRALLALHQIRRLVADYDRREAEDGQ